MKNIITFIAILFAASAAQANPLDAFRVDTDSEIHLVVNGKSRHFVSEARRCELRETNTGIGVEVRHTDDTFWMAGTYQDSYDAQASYVGIGKRWTIAEEGHVKFSAGVTGFLTHRKWDENSSMRVMPGILPVFTAQAGQLSANFLFVPRTPITKDAPTGFVQFSFRIK